MATRRKAKTTTRRRTGRRRMGAMGVNKAMIQNTAEGMIGGAIAALAVSSLAFVKSQPKTNQAIIIGVGSLAAAILLKKPAVAAGMAGVAGIMLGQGVGVLADNNAMYIPAISASSGYRESSVPYGLMEGGGDYAGLNDNIYASGYANTYGG